MFSAPSAFPLTVSWQKLLQELVHDEVDGARVRLPASQLAAVHAVHGRFQLAQVTAPDQVAALRQVAQQVHLVLVGPIGVVHADERQSPVQHLHGHPDAAVGDDQVRLLVVRLQRGGEAEKARMSRLVAAQPDLHQHLHLRPPGTDLVHGPDEGIEIARTDGDEDHVCRLPA